MCLIFSSVNVVVSRVRLAIGSNLGGPVALWSAWASHYTKTRVREMRCRPTLIMHPPLCNKFENPWHRATGKSRALPSSSTMCSPQKNLVQCLHHYRHCIDHPVTLHGSESHLYCAALRWKLSVGLKWNQHSQCCDQQVGRNGWGWISWTELQQSGIIISLCYSEPPLSPLRF